MALARANSCAISILSVCPPRSFVKILFPSKRDLQKHLYVLKNFEERGYKVDIIFTRTTLLCSRRFESRLVVERTIVTQRMKMEHESGRTGIKRPMKVGAQCSQTAIMPALFPSSPRPFTDYTRPFFSSSVRKRTLRRTKRSTTISILARLLDE